MRPGMHTLLSISRYGAASVLSATRACQRACHAHTRVVEQTRGTLGLQATSAWRTALQDYPLAPQSAGNQIPAELWVVAERPIL